VEGDGYLRNLKVVWVPGVPIEVDDGTKCAWRPQGPKTSVWVDDRICAVAYPTWEGTPIDTVIYGAFREGICDARYLATLLKYRAMPETEDGN